MSDVVVVVVGVGEGGRMGESGVWDFVGVDVDEDVVVVMRVIERLLDPTVAPEVPEVTGTISSLSKPDDVVVNDLALPVERKTNPPPVPIPIPTPNPKADPGVGVATIKILSPSSLSFGANTISFSESSSMSNGNGSISYEKKKRSVRRYRQSARSGFSLVGGR